MNYIVNVYELSDDGSSVTSVTAFEARGPFNTKASANRFILADVGCRAGEKITGRSDRASYYKDSYIVDGHGRHRYQFRYQLIRLI